MMIDSITIKSGLVPLIEGLCAQIVYCVYIYKLHIYIYIYVYMYMCIYNIFGHMKMKNDRSTHDTTLLVSLQLEQKAQVSEGSTEVALLYVRDKALTLHLEL